MRMAGSNNWLFIYIISGETSGTVLCNIRLGFWLRRFELYAQQARIPREQRVAELLSLLEDEPFRVVMHQGLDSDSEYSDVTECLKAQYNPDGNELEWQAKFQQWM